MSWKIAFKFVANMLWLPLAEIEGLIWHIISTILGKYWSI